MSSKEESTVPVIKHNCRIGIDGYCNCSDVPVEILKAARELVPELNKLSFEEIKAQFSFGKLICKCCGHRGILTDDIAGEAPGYPKGYHCNNETDFAICPQCGHWTLIEDPSHTQLGAEI